MLSKDDAAMVGDMYLHEPRPYLVRVRSSLSQDGPATVREFHVIAYSMLESMMQATMLAGAGPLPTDMKHIVEEVMPDLEVFSTAQFTRILAIMQATKDLKAKP